MNFEISACDVLQIKHSCQGPEGLRNSEGGGEGVVPETIHDKRALSNVNYDSETFVFSFGIGRCRCILSLRTFLEPFA